jgi:glycosyltransferase involved in cell wall biosynthesis
MKNNNVISIVIPCYNEEKNLSILVGKAKKTF